MQKTIHIGNLLSSTSEEELRQLLSQCAVPQAVKLAGDPSYPSRFVKIIKIILLDLLLQNLQIQKKLVMLYNDSTASNLKDSI